MQRVGISLFAAALLASVSVQGAHAQALSVSKEFNTPAQPLENALIEFSRISGVQVIASSDIVANKRAGAFYGKAPAEKALASILAGTGLTYRATGAATVTILRSNASPGSDAGSPGGDAATRSPLAAGGNAFATRPTAAPEPTSVAEVIVTAQKREQLLSKVPLSVTAFQGQSLEEHGQQNLVDYVGEAPGVSVNPSSNGFAVVEVRGISASIGDGTVGFYMDEIPFSLLGSTISPNLDSYDLNRVEVLRGPQGTLYGQGSMGGTIRLITNSPNLNSFDGKFDVSGGLKAFGLPDYSANAEVNIPILQDKLALRMVGSYQDMGGFLTDTRTGSKDVNPATKWDFRGELLFSPVDNLRITGTVWLERDHTLFSLGSFPNHTLTSGQGVDFIDVDTTAYNLLVQYKMPFADLTSSTSEMNFTFNADNNSVFLSPGAVTNVGVKSSDDNRMFSQELRLVSNGNGPFKWSIGGLYSDVKGDAVSLVNVLTNIDDFLQVGTIQDTTGDFSSKSWAVFGEASYLAFGGFLEPTIGLRYFSDDRGGSSITDTTETTTFLHPPPPSSSMFIPGTREAVAGTFTTLSPRFNLALHWSDNVLTYVNVAKGYRSGTFNSTEEAAIAAEFGINAGSVAPDTVWSYELGSKLVMDQNRLSVEAALYYSLWDGIQLLVTDPITFISFEVNGGRARAEGVEYAVDYRPIAGLALHASGNFNDSTLRTVNSSLSALTFLRPGDPLNYVPRTQFNGSATYTWDLGLGTGLKGYLYGGVDYHSSLSDTTASGILEGAPITLINLRGGVQTDRWGAYLYVNNLTDENSAVTQNSDGTAVRLEPRVIGINFRYAFK